MRNNISLSILTIGLLWAASFTATAQDRSERSSPPKEVNAKVGDNEVAITYSAPQKKGRTIFGDLVAYGKVWRTGANEASTITFGKDAKVGGKDVKAGKYALFAIPGEKEWTIILNEVWDQWGAYNYDESKDVARFTAKVEKLRIPAEEFEIAVDDKGHVLMMWDDTKVAFPIE
jgi:hypothetical protein